MTLHHATAGEATLSLAPLGVRLEVARARPHRLRVTGLAVSTPAAVALGGDAQLADDGVRLAPTWVRLTIIVAGNGLTIPATTSIAQGISRHAAGTASALQGGLPFLAGSLTLPLTGLMGAQSVLTMAAVSAGFYLVAAAVLVAGGSGLHASR